MKKYLVNLIEFVKYSKEDIADFLERIFSNSKVKELLFSLHGTFDGMLSNEAQLVNLLVKYCISVGDISDKMINDCVDEFAREKTKSRGLELTLGYSKSPDKKLFDIVYVPKIVKQVGQKLGIKEPYTLNNYLQMLTFVFAQNQINKFRTHSFNWAIYDEINANGLDISKELFDQEIEEYKPVGHQYYGIKNLYTCDLSPATFMYANICPERVMHTYETFNPHDIAFRRFSTDTIKEYLLKCVDSSLIYNYSLSKEKKEELKASAQNIIDFYYGHSNNAICVMENPKLGEQIDFEEAILRNLGKVGGKRQVDFYFAQIPAQTRDKICELRRSLREDRLTLIDNELDKLSNVSGTNAELVRVYKESVFAELLYEKAIGGLDTTYGDYNIIEGGKIPRDKMAIAVYEAPIKLHPDVLKKKYNMTKAGVQPSK